MVIALGLIAASGALIATKVVQNERFSLERAKASGTNFGKIERALIAWSVADTDHRYVCPGDPNPTTGMVGQSVDYSGSTSACTGGRTRGIVPYRDLGLSADDVRDGYGNFITYVVSTDTTLCNGDTPVTGTVQNQTGGAFHPFALISHGENGAGAWKGDTTLTEQNAATMSTAEQANCPSGTNQTGCMVGVDVQTVDDPGQDLTEGATYFDDVVFFPTTTARAYVGNCEEFNPSDPNAPEGAVAGGYSPIEQRTYTLSAEGSTSNRDAPAFDVLDVDGDMEDESDVLRFVDSDASATREKACAVNEQTLPLDGFTIRGYTEAYFEDDNSASPGTRGNGIVFGFLGYARTSGVAYDVPGVTSNGLCGGRDQYMGFAEENSTHRFPTDSDRFGFEVDTFNNRPGSPTATDILDPDENHFAIVLGDVAHYDLISTGDGTPGESPEDSGPVCNSDADFTGFGLADHDGTSPDARATPFGRSIDGGVGGANTDDQACITNGGTPPHDQPAEANWLENGEPFVDGDGVKENYQRFRFELHGETSNSCAASQIRLDGWVWRHDDPDIPADADDLRHDLGATEAPHVSQCITKHAMFRAVRFTSTIGLPASPTVFGAITLKRTGLNFERVDGAVKANAADNAESIAVNEDSVSADLGLSGNVTTDQSYSVVPDGGQNVRIYAGKGGFRLQNNNGLGVAGVGADDQRLDNIDPSDDTNYPDIDEFPDPDDREKIFVEFDEKMSQFTVTLRHFGETDNTGYYTTTNPLPRERVRLRAYDTTLDDNNELVAEETYDSCVANQSLGSNFANGSVVSTNFGGVRFDKVEIVPEPFDAQAAPEDDSQETWSAFVVGQVRGCGADETCGWDYSDVTGNVAFARSKCAELSFPASPANGGGITAEISPQTVEAQLGTSYNSSTSHNQAWLDLSGEAAGAPPGLGVDIYSPRGEIYIQDSTGGNAESQDGFAVGDTTIDLSNNTIDGGSDAATRESIVVRFDEAWDRAVIGLSRFGENTNDNDPERALVQFFLGGAQVGPDYTFTPCTLNGSNQTQNQWRVDGTVTTPSQFDTVQVTAIQDALGANSTFRLRALRACDSVDAGCQLDYGDENDAQPTRYCAFTCDSSGTCSAH